MAKFQWKSQEQIDQEKADREAKAKQLEEHRNHLDKAPENIEILGQTATDSQIENIEQGQTITEMQIEGMVQGQLMTDMEIRMLEMEVKLGV